MPHKVIAVRLFCNYNAVLGADAKQKIKFQVRNPKVGWETIGSLSMRPSEAMLFATILKVGYEVRNVPVSFEGSLMLEVEKRITARLERGDYKNLRQALAESTTSDED